MTFLQSAKYVGYGFFGMILFGMTVNKAFGVPVTSSMPYMKGMAHLCTNKPVKTPYGLSYCF